MKCALPLLAAATLLGGCQSMNDQMNQLGQVLGQGPRGPAPIRDPYSAGQKGSLPPGGMSALYRAIGTEPGWSLDIDQRTMRFSGPYGQRPITVATPRVIHGFAGETYQTPRLSVNIVHGRCSDGMSERVYSDQVQLTADGKAYRGCGGALVQGGIPGTAGGALADSRWHLISVNGRATPPKGDYHVDFTTAQLSAKFGCNGMGARYTLDRDMLSTDGLIGTQMACGEPAMSFESQGSAVLNRPARVRWSPGRATLTNNAGVIELERR